MDEVTFVLSLLEDNWQDARTAAGINEHKPAVTAINFIDVRSFEPNKGRRVDADEKSVIIVYQKDWADLTFSRTRLQSLYQIVRHIIERNGLRPSVIEGSSTYTADLIEITGRSEANDRGKRLLGYKMSVTMKRFGRTT